VTPTLEKSERKFRCQIHILIAKNAPALPVIPLGKIGGVPDKLPYQMNSGVMIYHPDDRIAAIEAEVLEDHENYFDQKALTRVMLYYKMEQIIDSRFNRLFFIRCPTVWRSLLGRHWFYHALAGKTKIRLLHWLLILKMQ